MEKVGDSQKKYTEGEKELRFEEFKAVSKVTEDVLGKDGDYGLNTAVSSIMEYVNAMHAYAGANTTIHDDVALEANKNLLKMLAPFTPHITEELWQICGFEGSVHQESWPQVDKTALVVDEIELPIQVNGKVRDRLTVAVDADKEALEAQVLALPHIKEFIGDKKVVKFIVVPKKIINIVVK